MSALRLYKELLYERCKGIRKGRHKTKMGKIVLSLLRGETSSSIIYMHLFILYKIKSFIPRNKEKAIYADLLKRSTLVES